MHYALSYHALSFLCAGVEILNGAIELLNARIPADKWTYVNVTVAPSTITITEHEVRWRLLWLTE